MKKPPDFLLVIWEDCSHYADSSMDRDEIEAESLMLMHTAGHFICETDKKICLAMDFIPDQARYRHITWLPKSGIIETRVLK